MNAALSESVEASNEVRLLKRLLECTRLLNSTLDLPELTGIVLQIIHDEMGFDRGTVFVIDSEKQSLRSFVAQGVEGFEIVLPVGAGVAGTSAAIEAARFRIPSTSPLWGWTPPGSSGPGCGRRWPIAGYRHLRP